MLNNDTAPTQTLSLTHGEMAYYRFGSGPDLVFIHGWPLNAATFRKQVAALKDSYTCHLFDLLGAGKSRWKSDVKVSPENHVKSLIEVLKTLGLKNYMMVGHDSGGATARAVAASLKEDVAGMVLFNTEFSNYHSKLFKLFMANVKFGGAPMVRFLFSNSALRRSPFVSGACFADANYGEGEFHELFVKPLLEDGRLLKDQIDFLRAYDPDVDAKTLNHAHQTLKCPIQLIWGAEDSYFPIDEAKKMALEFSGPTEFHTIEKAKLFPHEDFGEEVAELMKPFLAKHLSTKPEEVVLQELSA